MGEITRLLAGSSCAALWMVEKRLLVVILLLVHVVELLKVIQSLAGVQLAHVRRPAVALHLRLGLRRLLRHDEV